MAETGVPDESLGPMIDPRAAEAGAALCGLSIWRAAHASLIGPRCTNCAMAISGPFCLACGQSTESFERPIRSLFVELAEGLFHADGRLPRTLRALILRPGRLTRDYLDGRRASQTPPLRLFLVTILLFFFVGGLAQSSGPPMVWLAEDTPAEASASPGWLPPALAVWLAPRMAFATAHQREFGAAVESRLHETGILFLPVFTLLLGALFAFRRRIFLFDHAIFSMHSLSFMSLLFTLTTIIGPVAGLHGLAGLLMLAAPTHLFCHLRAVYATSLGGTLARVVLLLVLSSVSVAILLFADIALGLYAIG
jgi:hypothetical protein